MVIIKFPNIDNDKNFCGNISLSKLEIRNINLNVSKKLILLCDTISDNIFFKYIVVKLDLEVSLPKKIFLKMGETYINGSVEDALLMATAK